MSGTAPTKAMVKTSLPIELLPTDLARIITHAHPALLLAAYYIRFSAFVADPVQTLLGSLIPLAATQIGYAVLCLPSAGSDKKTVVKKKLNAPKKSNNDVAAKSLTVFFAFVLSLISVPAIAALQILFGAPITTHLSHTLLGSAHIALLAVFPLVYVHGAESSKWREIASLYSPVDEVFGASVGCLIGAWLGAVPIPLDWDREWQKWPVTIVTGAYAGYALGKLVGGSLLKGKRIEFD
ncbi:gpi-anchor biosynthesis protein (pig-f) [Phlyctema vagabunda]|uniref:Gpi-anchor biosynthesis protein (Pig-f) n=1 Tax=Phlyctema vagabunda TaxID=108571 RepID=A0ABR4PR20_9HELO